MKTAAIHPAEIQFGGDGAPPCSALYGDVYHPRSGAMAQAEHVFLRGNGLPERWAGRRRFVVLETGFGLGHNFLATWAAWRAHPERCERLVFVSIEAHPPHEADLRRVHQGCDLSPLATQLCEAWPRSTANLHLRRFEQGSVELLLAWGDIHTVLPELSTPADAFFLDGFAPDRNPRMWDAPVLKALGRLALADATLATWSVARSVHEGLSSAGFAVTKAPGFAHKREMTVARFVPRPGMRSAPRRRPALTDIAREAVIIGAGLAGASAAQALAARGWACTVVEAAHGPAQGASGNALGLYHGSQNAHDGPHARWHRAAALHLERCLAQAVESDPRLWAPQGLLRLAAPREEIDGMRRLLHAQALPEDYVRALTANEARELSGASLRRPAWFYPGGGWLAPSAWVARQLTREGIRLLADQAVRRIHRADGRWHIQGVHGGILASAPVLVLCAAHGNEALLKGAGLPWPRVGRQRGQISQCPAMSGMPRLRCAVSGHGYAAPLPDGGLLFGATVQHGDEEPGLREEDHAFNAARLHELTGWRPPAHTTIAGRVSWRQSTPDRLPLVGPLDTEPGEAACGLYVLAGLGSRGIASAGLGGEVLAQWIDGAPLALENDLLDALTPSRLVSRS